MRSAVRVMAMVIFAGLIGGPVGAVSKQDPEAVRIAEGIKLCDQADGLLAQGKPAEALKLYRQVIEFLPTSPRAKGGVGKCLALLPREALAAVLGEIGEAVVQCGGFQHEVPGEVNGEKARFVDETAYEGWGLNGLTATYTKALVIRSYKAQPGVLTRDATAIQFDALSLDRAPGVKRSGEGGGTYQLNVGFRGRTVTCTGTMEIVGGPIGLPHVEKTDYITFYFRKQSDAERVRGLFLRAIELARKCAP